MRMPYSMNFGDRETMSPMKTKKKDLMRKVISSWNPHSLRLSIFTFLSMPSFLARY